MPCYAVSFHSRVPVAEKHPVNSQQQPKVITKTSDTAPIGQKISTMVFEFLKNEGRNIMDNLEARELQLETVNDDHLFKKLDPRIRLEIDSILDDYNKLQALLSYHPLAIHPELYLHFLNKIQVPLEDDVRSLLLRRLTFHRLFDECWSVMLSDSPSLNDLEDSIEIIITELRLIGDLSFGGRSLLWSLYSNSTSPNLTNMLIESICKHLRVGNAYKIRLAYLYDALRSCSLEPEICTFDEQIFLISKLDPQGRYFNLFIKTLATVAESSIHDLLILPGILSGFWDIAASWKARDLLLADHYATINMLLRILSKSQEKLTLKDTMCIIEENYEYVFSPSYVVFQEKIVYHGTDGRRTFSNLAFPLLQTHDKFYEFMNAELSSLDASKIAEVLFMAIKSNQDAFKSIMLRLSNKSTKFDIKEIARSFFSNNDHLTVSDVEILYELLKDLRNITVSSFFVSEWIKSIKMATQYSLAINPRDFIPGFAITRTVTLEYIRMVLASSPPSMEKFEVLFNSLLEDLASDLQHNLMNNALDKKKRRLFHNTARALGQTISLISTHDKVRILCNISNSIHEIAATSSTKAYLLKNITGEIFRFTIKNSRDERSAIEVLREIHSKIDYPDQTLYGAIVMLYISIDPLLSMVLLEHFKSCKSYLSNDIVRYILRGILSSGRLNDRQKVNTFLSFRKYQNDLGYKALIPKSTLIDLIDIILRLAADSNQYRDMANQIMAKNLYKKGIPLRIQEKWRHVTNIINTRE